ncbi:MAG: hypothetical protein JWN33_495 [Candidatus Saccharibacteria bacterium]|nr:hypothetical protein [Candidatus Saccharibacteria bacterium]
MIKKILFALAVLGISFAVLPTTTASAHTNSISSTCEALTVNLINYAPEVQAQAAVQEQSHMETQHKYTRWQSYQWVTTDWLTAAPAGTGWTITSTRTVKIVDKAAVAAVVGKSNTVKVTIDGVVKADTTFGTTYNTIFSLGDKYVSHNYNVTVVAYDNHQYDVNKSGTSTPCPKPVVPSVTFTQPTCTTLGSYTIVAVEGVQYKINGEVVAAGTYPAQNGSTVTVTASATSASFVFDKNTKVSFSSTFTAPQDCTVEQPPVVPTTPVTPGKGSVLGASTITTLPYTGSSASVIAATAFSIFAAISTILGFALRRAFSTKA